MQSRKYTDSDIKYLGDAYKYTHQKMSQSILKDFTYSSYFGPRQFKDLNYCIFFGLNYYLNQIWDLCKEYKVEIRALREGTFVGPEVPFFIVKSSEKSISNDFYRVLETFLSRVWYPSTVATLSYSIRRLLTPLVVQTCTDVNWLNYLVHDFGARSCTTQEQAEIGGLAHLLSFDASDTCASLAVKDQELGYSFSNTKPLITIVDASEHSIMTILGKNGEFEVVSNILSSHFLNNGRGNEKPLSLVIDSYDAENFINELTNSQSANRHAIECQRIIKSLTKPLMVFRPDSGDPFKLIPKFFEQLYQFYGGTVNSKGYKVLSKNKILWGDGLSGNKIVELANYLVKQGYSLENFIFAMGTNLLQNVNRDMFKFKWAGNGVSILASDKFVSINKSPVTMPEKSTLYGNFDLYNDCGSDILNINKLNTDKFNFSTIGGNQYKEITQCLSSFETIKSRVRKSIII